MKKSTCFFIAILCHLSIVFGQQQTNKPFCDPKIHVPNEEQLGIIYDHVKSFPENTQVSFAFIEQGKVYFYGIRRVGDAIPRCDNYDHVFEVGSVTKVFTATLLAHFVLNKTLALDEPINAYLNIKLKDNIQITFRQLANHSSGLPRLPANFQLGAMLSPANPYKSYDKTKLETYLSEQLRLTHPQGEKSDYSNLGSALLAYTLCQKTGKDYQQLLQEIIFAPYAMMNSTTNREDIVNPFVKGLDAKGKETDHWDLGAMEGAGSILSTVEDLSKFALAQMDTSQSVLALTRVKTFKVNDNMDIGLGWHILHGPKGTNRYWHNGGTGGYTSSMALDIEGLSGIIILSNVSTFNPDARKLDELCFALLKTIGN